MLGGPDFNVLRQVTQLEKCIHCGQLILRKISKTGATRYQILRLKCTKFDIWRDLTILYKNIFITVCFFSYEQNHGKQYDEMTKN